VSLDLAFKGQDYNNDILLRMEMLRKGKVSLCRDCLVSILIYKTFVQASGLIYKHFGTILSRNIYLKVHERHVKTKVECVSFTRICSDKR